MIKRADEYELQPREAVRGGEGTALFTHLLSADERPGASRLFATITLPPDASIGVHSHEGETEVFYVLQGFAEYNDNGKMVTIEEGDTAACASGESHGIKNIGQEELVLMAVIISD